MANEATLSQSRLRRFTSSGNWYRQRHQSLDAQVLIFFVQVEQLLFIFPPEHGQDSSTRNPN